MRRLIVISTLLILLSAIGLQAQSAIENEGQKRAEDWIKRLNALDDWYITLEGKESSELAQVVDSFMELFAPDVIAELPPHDEDQLGPVMLRGTANLRKWVERIARTRVRLLYMHKRQTEGPTGEFEGWRLAYTTPLPWGGTGLVFPIISVYSLREDRTRRYTGPGAVFLQYGQDGKIRRMRILEAEMTQVVPL